MQTTTQPISYEPSCRALVFVDPYNDFLSEGGKFWPMVSDVAASVKLLDNLRAIVSAARKAGLTIVIAPHHRAEPHDFASWDHPTPYQLQVHKVQGFAKGSWGGDWHPDFAPQPADKIAKEHWISGFANTDLDLLLKQSSARKVILIGLVANTCVEGTARYAADLGYHVTLVRDATAAFSMDGMHAAHDVNGPSFAHAITTTANLLTALRAG